MIVYREATLEDAVSLTKRLRESDHIEVSLAAGGVTDDLLMDSVGGPTSIEAWAAEVDGLVVALWGVHQQKLVVGVPWLLCSPEVARYAKRLVKDGRQWVNRISIQFPILTNMVHAENTSSINWLKSLGFTIGPLHPEYGAGKAPFYQFYKYSPLCVSH